MVFSKLRRTRRLCSGDKRLIIGRKGSGKSAICMVLAGTDHSATSAYVTSLITPDLDSFEQIRGFALQGVPDQVTQALFWRYVVSVQIAKYIVAHTESNHPKLPTSVKKLQRFLKSNGEVADPKFHREFWVIIQRIKSLSMGAFGAKISFELDAPSEGLKISNKLKVIESTIQRALEDLNCPPNHAGLLLLVDQVEQIWSNDSASDTMVMGLLLAGKHVSKKFSKIRCVIFLRSDIYDALQFTEADKFHGDEMRIDWTPAALADLLLTRARLSLGVEIPQDYLWGQLFPHRRAGHKTKEYLLARTQLRPRDLIQFANVCRDTAVQNGHDSITAEDMRQAELIYSRLKLQDLTSEYRVNYPFLDQLFAVFRNAQSDVTRQLIGKRLDPAIKRILRRYPEYASSLNSRDIIDILYSIGFLGVERKGSVVYIYDDPVLVEPEEFRFHIHPSVRPALRSESASPRRNSRGGAKDLDSYNSSDNISIGAVGSGLASSVNVGGIQREFVVRGDIEYSMLEAIQQVATRINRAVYDSRSSSKMFKEVSEPINEHLERMLSDAKLIEGRITQGRLKKTRDSELDNAIPEVDDFIHRTVDSLSDLGAHLRRIGAGGNDLNLEALGREIENGARYLSDLAGFSHKARRKR